MKEPDRNNTGVIKDITPEERITNSLLLNASFTDNLGLMHGKAGISIYFYRLARATGNQIYEDYAGELIDEIYEEITGGTPWDFENGLAGIGWGIEYLVQNGFIEADTDEVLEEFDHRLFRQLIYNTPADIGLLNGLLGIGFYFLMRIKNNHSNDDNIRTLTNKQTLIHLIDELDRRTKGFHPSASPKGESSEGLQNKKSPLGDLGDLGVTKPTTHDHPLLLLFLAELYEQDIFNYKVEKLIARLLKPLEDKSNLPQSQHNRLLLELALLKLKTVDWTFTAGATETLNPELVTLNPEPRTRNLEPQSPTLKNGTAGIAFICQLLYQLTGKPEYKLEAEYWTTQTFSFEETDSGFAGFDLKDETKAFGLLEGLTGIGLIKNANNKYSLSSPATAGD